MSYSINQIVSVGALFPDVSGLDLNLADKLTNPDESGRFASKHAFIEGGHEVSEVARGLLDRCSGEAVVSSAPEIGDFANTTIKEREESGVQVG